MPLTATEERDLRVRNRQLPQEVSAVNAQVAQLGQEAQQTRQQLAAAQQLSADNNATIQELRAQVAMLMAVVPTIPPAALGVQGGDTCEKDTTVILPPTAPAALGGPGGTPVPTGNESLLLASTVGQSALLMQRAMETNTVAQMMPLIRAEFTGNRLFTGNASVDSFKKISEFFRHFELFAQSLELKASTCVALFPSALGDPARRVFSSAPEAVRRDYVAIKRFMLDKFEPLKDHRYLNPYDIEQQKQNESLTIYAYRVLDFVEKCMAKSEYTDDQRLMQAKRVFVMKLALNDLRNEVEQFVNKKGEEAFTFDEMLKWAKQQERYAYGRAGKTPPQAAAVASATVASTTIAPTDVAIDEFSGQRRQPQQSQHSAGSPACTRRSPSSRIAMETSRCRRSPRRC